MANRALSHFRTRTLVTSSPSPLLRALRSHVPSTVAALRSSRAASSSIDEDVDEASADEDGPSERQSSSLRASSSALARRGASKRSSVVEKNVEHRRLMTEAAPEAEKHWRSTLDSIEDHVAKRLLPAVTFEDSPLGLGAVGRKGVPLIADMEEWKALHPDKIILARCGDFYEASGVDAVMLVAFVKLKPMGNKVRAGCPAVSIRPTLRKLLLSGFSVAVVEEKRGAFSHGSARSARSRKDRYIGDIVTPARPVYRGADVFSPDESGLFEGGEGAELESPLSPTLLGIAADSSGFTLMEADLDLRVVEVTEGLSAEAVESRIYRGGLSPPVYLHDSIDRTGDVRAREEWTRRIKVGLRSFVADQSRAFSHFSDPVEGFVQAVTRDQGLDLPPPPLGSTEEGEGEPVPSGAVPHEPFRIMRRTQAGRPRPLYLSTATQIGVEATRGVPSLVDALLPREAPQTYRKLLKNLLLVPPPFTVSDGIRQAVSLLRSTREPLPELSVLSPGKVSILLGAQPPVNLRLMRDIQALCRDVEVLCAGGAAAAERLSMVEALLPAVSAAIGVEGLKPEGLVGGCRRALAVLDPVLAEHATAEALSGSPYDPFLKRVFDAARRYYSCRPPNAKREVLTPAEVLEAARGAVDQACSMLASKEGALRTDWRGYVSGQEDVGGDDEDLRDFKLGPGSLRSPVFLEALREAEEEGKRVLLAVEALFDQLTTHLGESRAEAKLVHNEKDDTLWLAFEPNLRSVEKADVMRGGVLEMGRTRYGEQSKNRMISPELAEALQGWRRTCHALESVYEDELRRCAAELRPQCALLQSAAFLSLLMGTLKAHVKEAQRKGWTEARIEAFAPDPQANASGLGPRPADRVLSFEGLVPYWLEAGQPGTVRNSFEMDGLFLLTGANMSGKSTVLRSTCAAALCGTVGLMVPVTGAMQLPRLDAVLLRNFSQDDVLEGRSSFMVEMTQMKAVLEEASDRSLILLDELGRGTSPESGAAIAGAMVEELAARRPLGVFATHLHALFELPLRRPHTGEWMMEVERDERGVLFPTHRMVPGRTTESMAIQVAAECGVQPSVVQRARQLLSLIEEEAAADGALPQRPPPLPSDSAPHLSDSPAVIYRPEQSRFSLEGARAALVKCLREVVPELGGQLEAAVHVIDSPGLEPPPSACNRACVYVVRRPEDGAYYVGETDRLDERFKEHKRRKPVKGGPRLELVYCPLPSSKDEAEGEAGAAGRGLGGKSRARRLEAALIEHLGQLGFPLISTKDARNRTFGD